MGAAYNLVQLNDKWSKETEARSLASMLALRKAMKQFPIKNAVSLHSSIEKATRNKELQSYITDSFDFEPIATFTVSGKQPTTKRNAIVNEFAKSNKALITNAKCLTEGVDVPNIDCIVFADPRKSKVDIVQALGRALRKKEGKEWGYVILPVIYDDITHEIDNENFEEILAIVRGLASNDERIIEYFKDKSDKLNPTKKTDKQFNFDVFSEFINENELSEQLQIRLWDKLSRFNWMPFEKAREFVRGLGLKSQKEWREYLTSKSKPYNITSKPERVYQNVGWISFKDWIGTLKDWDGKWEDFNIARDYVRSLKLQNQNEWNEYSKSNEKPCNIPSTPERAYKGKGWISLGDWLGTNNEHRKDFLSFQEARNIVRSFGLKNQNDWRKWRKTKECPTNMPSQPEVHYKKMGWISFGDFIGSTPDWDGTYLSYSEAKILIAKLCIRSRNEWLLYSKSEHKPKNIPSSPQTVYIDEWQGWGDFLSNNVVAPQNMEFISYEEASNLVQELGIKSFDQFQKFKLRHDFPYFRIPKAPNVVYKNKGWIGFSNFFGKNSIEKYDYSRSKEYVKLFKIKNLKEWHKFSKSERPNFIPSNPQKFYKSEWKGWADFLGKE